jgi:hypothetical protein
MQRSGLMSACAGYAHETREMDAQTAALITI